jgi:hypothetical protein
MTLDLLDIQDFELHQAQANTGGMQEQTVPDKQASQPYSQLAPGPGGVELVEYRLLAIP